MRSTTLSKHDRNPSGVAFLPAITSKHAGHRSTGGTFKIRRNLPSSLSGAPTARGGSLLFGLFPLRVPQAGSDQKPRHTRKL